VILDAIMDVVVWLRSLGLGKYEAAFRENEITEKVLPNLTAEDLKDLGISIVGHRRVEKIESLEAERENASPEVTVIDTDAGLLHLASIVKAAEIRQRSAIASIACPLRARAHQLGLRVGLCKNNAVLCRSNPGNKSRPCPI
jgi:hypothetical protein